VLVGGELRERERWVEGIGLGWWVLGGAQGHWQLTLPRKPSRPAQHASRCAAACNSQLRACQPASCMAGLSGNSSPAEHSTPAWRALLPGLPRLPGLLWLPGAPSCVPLSGSSVGEADLGAKHLLDLQAGRDDADA